MKGTKEENSLLNRLASGALDGHVGDDLTTSGGSRIWTAIKNGIPTRYKKGPGGKFFNGKENEHYEGILHIQQEWKTDSEKLEFIQKYGWLMDDPDAHAYSAKFKPKK